MMQITENSPNELSTENGRVDERSLSASQNPALARLAGTIATQGSRDSAESYSRMHHRHNRN